MANYGLNDDDFSNKEAFQLFKCIISLGYTITISRSEDFDLYTREGMKKFEDWLVEEGSLAFSEYIMSLSVTDINFMILRKYLKKFHKHVYYALRYKFKSRQGVMEYIKQFKTIGEFIKDVELEPKLKPHARFGFQEERV